MTSSGLFIDVSRYVNGKVAAAKAEVSNRASEIVYRRENRQM